MNDPARAEEKLDQKTLRALSAINRRFYRESAEEFSATRERPWPGWTPLLELAERHLPGPELDVLDVGCGNGRFAAFLARRGAPFHYLGIDASASLLERARARRLPAGSASYRCADFLETPLDDCLPPRSFSLVVLFGVLHHVPGREQRLRLLQGLRARLRPGGLLALTSWQFEAFRRFRDRLIPWGDFNRSAPEPIDLSQLEPGDHLLPWGGRGGRSGGPLRFCHFTDDTEMATLLEDASLECVASFGADGREGNLNRYFALRSRA